MPKDTRQQRVQNNDSNYLKNDKNTVTDDLEAGFESVFDSDSDDSQEESNTKAKIALFFMLVFTFTIVGASLGYFFPLAIAGLTVTAGILIGGSLGAGVGFSLSGLSDLLTDDEFRGVLQLGVGAGGIGAGIGAVIGSIIAPGVGTIIGAGVGAFVGMSIVAIPAMIQWLCKPCEPDFTIHEEVGQSSHGIMSKNFGKSNESEFTNIVSTENTDVGQGFSWINPAKQVMSSNIIATEELTI